MKKIKTVSTILLVVELIPAIYWLAILGVNIFDIIFDFTIGILLGFFDVEVLLLNLGVYFALPSACIGIVLNIILMIKSSESRRNKWKYIIISILHMFLGLWNFIMCNVLLNI